MVYCYHYDVLMKAFISLLSLLVITVWIGVFTRPDQNLHIVACDVGQGDGILIFQGSTEIIIDGGTKGKMLPCISRHRPFWDRTIDVVMVTHPQEDHYGGLIEVVESYTIRHFIENSHDSSSQSYQLLQKLLGEQEIPTIAASDIQSIRSGLMHFDILFPQREDRGVTLSSDPNDSSIIAHLKYGEVTGLFTGDMSPRLIEYVSFKNRLSDITYLKVPHHGSKNGLTKELLNTTTPEVAVISVGTKNRYGHPHQAVMDLLKDIKTYRTDEAGDIEFVTDGKTWWLAN